MLSRSSRTVDELNRYANRIRRGSGTPGDEPEGHLSVHFEVHERYNTQTALTNMTKNRMLENKII